MDPTLVTTAYPELLWALGCLRIDPAMVDEAYVDSWFTFQGLLDTHTIPAIPPAYRREHEEGRALYVLGFPPTFTPLGMKNLFSNIGDVEKCIVVVDCISRCSFRWVVMATLEEAEEVIYEVQNLVLADTNDNGQRTYKLRVCKSVGPQKHANIHEPAPVERVVFEPAVPRSLQLPRIVETVHGHPSPPSPVHSTPPGNDHILTTQYDPGEEITPTPKSWSAEDGDVEDETDDEEPVRSTVNKTPPQIFVTQAASWAAIANTANPNAQLINLHPGKSNHASRLKPAGRVPQVLSHREGHESMVDQIRVVFLLDLPQTLTVQDISDAVKEGPLRSISFGFDDEKEKRFAGVVFQSAADAEQFHAVLTKERAESKPDRFKFVVEAIRGEPFLMDEYIKLMGPPTYASRRLTIVKSRFFFMFGERQLRALCEKLVGSDSIQLIWLYNGGNATIVFSDVPSAITVKNALDKMAAGINLPGGQSAATWDGLQTTFSKDPCVAPLELKTAMTV